MTESTKAQRCGSRKGKQNASLAPIAAGVNRGLEKVAPEFPYWLHATSPNGVIEGLPTLIGTWNGVSESVHRLDQSATCLNGSIHR